MDLWLFNYQYLSPCLVEIEGHFFSIHSVLGTWALQVVGGDIGVCGISVILILNCGIAVFSKSAGCGFLAFWTG